jgi:NIMA (never in mitosis gene a)-related kinase
MSLKDFSLICKLGTLNTNIIGEGAYSTVYKVERLTDKKIYALKKVKLANLS